MSKRIEAKITCPNCSHRFDYTLYRSIWGEYTENRELVMSNQINVATCPSCKTSTKLIYPFIYTNAKQCFAVWWEPYYDAQIDKDAEGYKNMLGAGNYLATVPRIKDWSEFKETIIKFENGILKGNRGTISKDMHQQIQGFLESIRNSNSKQKSGYLGEILLFLEVKLEFYKKTMRQGLKKMLNIFKKNKDSAIKEVWRELCVLDNFLNKKLGKFITSQSRIEVSNWEFINKPLSILEKQRPYLNYELYDFAKNELFINTLQPDINKLLDLLRECLRAKQYGDQSKYNILLMKCNLQLEAISKNYLKKLHAFRDLAERLTSEKFDISIN